MQSSLKSSPLLLHKLSSEQYNHEVWLSRLLQAHQAVPDDGECSFVSI